MIIGVTGKISAGHNIVGEILQNMGFKQLSLSDYLREEMKRRGIEINRENMRNFGDYLRKNYGSGFVAPTERPISR